VRVEGREHLQGLKPCVIVANHTQLCGRASADGRALEWITVCCEDRSNAHAAHRYVSCASSATCRLTVPIRGHGEGLRRKLNRSSRGESVFIFPEGTFTAHEGMRPFQLGAFKAAAATGCPVVPIGVSGMRQFMRDGTWLASARADHRQILPHGTGRQRHPPPQRNPVGRKW